MLRILLLALLVPSVLTAQAAAPDDMWTPLTYFEGSWTADISGNAGDGKGEREYGFIFDGTYLHHKNRAVFEPQEKNPEGEIHYDWGFFSYDTGRGLFVLREFHSEGYINRYILDSLASSDSVFVFITEAVENGPPGMRARTTITIVSDDEFTEGFELAMPGKDFSGCITTRWTRVK